MMTLLETGTAAFLVGLAGSLHCVGMCGPLACLSTRSSSPLAAAAYWHVGRTTAYVTLGALVGTFSHWVLGMTSAVQKILPWIFIAGLLLSSLALFTRYHLRGPLEFVGRWIYSKSSRYDPKYQSLGVGLATPFLPCGLFYGTLFAAAGTGSALSGALSLCMFSLGGAPALLLVQSQWKRWASSKNRWVRYGQLAMVGIALAVVSWRTAHGYLNPAIGAGSCH